MRQRFLQSEIQISINSKDLHWISIFTAIFVARLTRNGKLGENSSGCAMRFGGKERAVVNEEAVNSPKTMKKAGN